MARILFPCKNTHFYTCDEVLERIRQSGAELLAQCLSEHAARTGGHLRCRPNGLAQLELDDCSLGEIADRLLAFALRAIELPRTAEQIMDAVDQHLRTAKLGLTDMRGPPDRRRAGLMNAVVFGRSATFALQNLRNIVPNFDGWYEVQQTSMRDDPLMKFFNEIRRKIEHEAHVPGGSLVAGSSLDLGRVMRDMGPAPPGATGFFIGDPSGGSGWEIVLPDGTKEKFYVDLPASAGTTVEMVLRPAPPGYESATAADLVAAYLSRVEAITKEARQKFVRLG